MRGFKKTISLFLFNWLLSLKLSVISQTVRTDFFKPSTYITHNAAKPWNDITGGNLSDYMQLPLEQTKDFMLLFFFFLTYSVVLPVKTCKHMFMCDIGGVTP